VQLHAVLLLLLTEDAMLMSAQARADFVNAYTRVLITGWSSEEYDRKLDTNPREALAEAGLELPAGAEVVVVRTAPSDDASLDTQVELYERGLATGRFEFHLTGAPRVDLAELVEGDLEYVSAAVNVPCCCTPCCCCA
jgi:hypothetical protein